MKRIIALLTTLVFLFSFASCGVKVVDSKNRGALNVYLDGESIGTITVDNLNKKSVESEFDGVTFSGNYVEKILKSEDLSGVKAAFTKSTDGTAQYFADISNLFVANCTVEDGKYISLADAQGKDCFGVAEGNTGAIGVTDIYLLTDAQDWKTEVTVNGTSKTITIADFMAMNPTYQTLKHKYDGGANEFEGDFLCVDSKTFWEYFGLPLTEGTNDNGLPVYYEEGMNIFFTGMVQSANTEPEEKINYDLKPNPLVDKTGWQVYYFILINGNDYHDIISSDLGLSCIFNDTGVRWMTTPITKVEVSPVPEVTE